MTGDDVFKAAVGAILGAFTGVVGWLVRALLKVREDALTQGERLKMLGAKVERIDGEQLDKETVRGLLEETNAKRDAAAFERRKEFDRRLALEIKREVQEGVAQCRRDTAEDMERLFRRFRSSGSGEVEGLGGH